MKTTSANMATIKLNDAFIRLASGAATIREVLVERAAKLADEDDYTRRHREWREGNGAFTGAYSH